mmetsp:Transcript_35675/g.76065  ORF Transcript_35675/g.76065 Transcript_35675/m.76065 type:complete len:337 (-) Transcript_35675:309-1319(-)
MIRAGDLPLGPHADSELGEDHFGLGSRHDVLHDALVGCLFHDVLKLHLKVRHVVAKLHQDVSHVVEALHTQVDVDPRELNIVGPIFRQHVGHLGAAVLSDGPLCHHRSPLRNCCQALPAARVAGRSSGRCSLGQLQLHRRLFVLRPRGARDVGRVADIAPGPVALSRSCCRLAADMFPEVTLGIVALRLLLLLLRIHHELLWHLSAIHLIIGNEHWHHHHGHHEHALGALGGGHVGDRGRHGHLHHRHRAVRGAGPPGVDVAHVAHVVHVADVGHVVHVVHGEEGGAVAAAVVVAVAVAVEAAVAAHARQTVQAGAGLVGRKTLGMNAHRHRLHRA